MFFFFAFLICSCMVKGSLILIELILQPNLTASSLFFTLCMGEWMHACTCLSLDLPASLFSHSASFMGTKKQKHRVVASFINEVLARAPPPHPHLLCFKYPEHRFPRRLRVRGGRWTSCRYSAAVYSLADTRKLAPLWSSRLMKRQCEHVRSGQLQTPLLRPCLYLLHTCSFSWYL